MCSIRPDPIYYFELLVLTVKQRLTIRWFDMASIMADTPTPLSESLYYNVSPLLCKLTKYSPFSTIRSPVNVKHRNYDTLPSNITVQNLLIDGVFFLQLSNYLWNVQNLLIDESFFLQLSKISLKVFFYNYRKYLWKGKYLWSSNCLGDKRQ